MTDNCTCKDYPAQSGGPYPERGHTWKGNHFSCQAIEPDGRRHMDIPVDECDGCE